MHTAPSFKPAAAAPGPATTQPAQRRVVDAPTRMFHALFALSFLGAYLTAESEHWRALHVTLGYTLAGLLAFRVLYGLIGPRHARLQLLLGKLRAGPAWLRATTQSLRQGTWAGINGRQGQNLLMALAVLALLVLTVPLTLSGYANYNEWGDVLGAGGWGNDALEAVHEFFGNAFLAVVLVHTGLIVVLSLLRRRNQALPMLTGRIDGAGPDLVKRNNGALAALLLVAVLAFIGWQWQQSPQGLLPSAAVGWGSAAGDDDDD